MSQPDILRDILTRLERTEELHLRALGRIEALEGALASAESRAASAEIWMQRHRLGHSHLSPISLRDASREELDGGSPEEAAEEFPGLVIHGEGDSMDEGLDGMVMPPLTSLIVNHPPQGVITYGEIEDGGPVVNHHGGFKCIPPSIGHTDPPAIPETPGTLSAKLDEAISKLVPKSIFNHGGLV